MTYRLPIFLIVVMTALAACDRPRAAWQSPASTTTTRPAAIPPSDVLTLATSVDLAAGAAIAADPAIVKAVNVYLGPGAPRWQIVAARPVGDYVLLWLAYPNITDGGVDLVYSRKDQSVRWQFKGGQRG